MFIFYVSIIIKLDGEQEFEQEVVLFTPAKVLIK